MTPTSKDEEDEPQWMTLERPYAESAGVQVLLNNQEHLALRMSKLEDLVRAMSTGATRRPRSASEASAAESVNSVSTTAGKADENALSLIKDSFMNTVKDQHTQWLDVSKKKPITIKTSKAKTDETEFFKWIMDKNLPYTFGQDEWDDHPLKAALSQLQIETRQQMYVDLNKEHVEAEKQKDGKETGKKAPPRSSLKSANAGDKRTRKSNRVQTMSESQRTDKETLSDPLQARSSDDSISPPNVPARQRQRTRKNVLDDDEDEGAVIDVIEDSQAQDDDDS